MPQRVHMRPCIDVGREVDDTPCPTCGRKPSVWGWWVEQGKGRWAHGHAATKAQAIADAQAYARQAGLMQ